jgi:hypothetical protein
MSDDDKRTYRQLLVIAVLSVCVILFLIAAGTLYAEHACIQLWFQKGLASEMPDFCHKGALGKFVLEFLGIAVGVLGAIKLLG